MSSSGRTGPGGSGSGIGITILTGEKATPGMTEGEKGEKGGRAGLRREDTGMAGEEADIRRNVYSPRWASFAHRNPVQKQKLQLSGLSEPRTATLQLSL